MAGYFTTDTPRHKSMEGLFVVRFQMLLFFLFMSGYDLLRMFFLFFSYPSRR